MPSLADMLVQVANEPDPRPYSFEIGQKVRVVKSVVEDGQTPAYWAGAIVTVIARKSSWLHKDHWYTLEHSNGMIDDFREEELDFRFCKGKK